MSCAAILTGGRARRFGGVDKAALLVDGRSILDRQIAALAGISAISKIFLVGGAGHHAAAESIADTIADSGPLAGIHSALMAARAAGDDHVFVLACDMPDVSTAFIAYLL